MVSSKVMVKSIAGLINIVFGTPLCKGIDTTPQYRFDALGA
jgi:hypothetical protein